MSNVEATWTIITPTWRNPVCKPLRSPSQCECKMLNKKLGLFFYPCFFFCINLCFCFCFVWIFTVHNVGIFFAFLTRYFSKVLQKKILESTSLCSINWKLKFYSTKHTYFKKKKSLRNVFVRSVEFLRLIAFQATFKSSDIKIIHTNPNIVP